MRTVTGCVRHVEGAEISRRYVRVPSFLAELEKRSGRCHAHGVDRASARRDSPRAPLQQPIGQIDVHMKNMCCNGPLTLAAIVSILTPNRMVSTAWTAPTIFFLNHRHLISHSVCFPQFQPDLTLTTALSLGSWRHARAAPPGRVHAHRREDHASIAIRF